MSLKSEKVFCGNGVSPGIVLGQALTTDSQRRVVLRASIAKGEVSGEIRRLEQAIQVCRDQLKSLKKRLDDEVGHEQAYILDAHLLMLEDKSLIGEMTGLIRERTNAEWAVSHVAERIRRAYTALDDEYFRERVSDLEAVLDRVVASLSGAKPLRWDDLPGSLVVVSRDFNPSILAAMDLERIRGIALERGGRTSHTAILARSLGIPAVMEIDAFVANIVTGDSVLLDGDAGVLVLNPTAERLDSARARLEEFSVISEPSPVATLPAATRDGVRISLKANTELPMEVRSAQRSGAEGIGLFRSELLFLRTPGRIPGMTEQLETYSLLAREMSPHPVAIRTLDLVAEIGGFRTDLSGQQNPSMGLRGIRLSLMRQDLFASQIEAILRSSNSGNVEIVLPMVAAVEEVREAKTVISRISRNLAVSGDVSTASVPVGLMIEVPAAVIALETLAREVDFLCVGTNDLIQYLLAVDRANPQVAHLFRPLHPAMLHSLQRIATVAGNSGKPVRICGEMCANPFFAILLVGMGFTELSMNSMSIPTVRRIIRETTMTAAAAMSRRAMEFSTASEVAEFLLREVGRLSTADLSPYVKEVTGATPPFVSGAATGAPAG